MVPPEAAGGGRGIFEEEATAGGGWPRRRRRRGQGKEGGEVRVSDVEKGYGHKRSGFDRFRERSSMMKYGHCVRYFMCPSYIL